MSLLDRSKWEQLQTQCWRELKERREKRICLKCGIFERCTINKVYAKDGETIQKYVLDSEYEYNENTVEENGKDICWRCRGVMFGWYELSIKTTNRPQVEEIFRDINKNEAHDLFLLTASRPEMTNTLPTFKRKLTKLQSGLENISREEYRRREEEYNTVINEMKRKVKELEIAIDKKIGCLDL